MEESNVRATSERVVSSKVIKKSGPLGKMTGFFGDFTKSITGILGGCVMLVIGFGIIIAGVIAVSNDSKKVDELEVMTAEEALEEEGLVEVKAKPDVISPARLTYTLKDDYGFESEETFENDAIYLAADYQIYEQVEEKTTETRTVVRNGEEVEETVEKTEIKEEWVSKKTAEDFGEFSFGNIEINTKNISKRFDEETLEIKDVVIPGVSTAQVYENPSSQIGSTKLVVSYVPVEDELIVVGEIENEKINDGEVFLISNLSDAELVDRLKAEENAVRWGLRFVAWLLLTLGFSAFVAPILVLSKLVPGLNKTLGCVTTLVFGVLSAAIVLLVSVLVSYWWLVILCGVVLAVAISGIGVFMLVRKRK